MTSKYLKASKRKRFNKLHERIFFRQEFRLIFGLTVVYTLTSIILPEVNFTINGFGAVINSLLAVFVLFLTSDFMIARLSKYPAVHGLLYVMPVLIGILSIIMLSILIFRIDYSRSVLMTASILVSIYTLIASYVINKYYRKKIAIIPLGQALDLTGIHNITWRILKTQSLGGVRYDAITADFGVLNKEWERFVAAVSLDGSYVISAERLRESLTGRVKVDHLIEGKHGNLLPSLGYSMLKRLADVVIVLVITPIAFPITLIAALIVKFESPGGAFFLQKRVGVCGKEFTIYKLRSMCCDSEAAGAKFASNMDFRVTKFGKFIRKSRIDELPQFLNVLKGDMSLIGPRPEQKIFVSQFEKTIPFYGYRHVVRPGITGWAQVTHGYAASEDETRLKLEHDLYYIKNFSLWLDILIVFKTIHTMLTGFGAR